MDQEKLLLRINYSVDYAEPNLLFRASNGKIEKEYNIINEWAKSIYNQIT